MGSRVDLALFMVGSALYFSGLYVAYMVEHKRVMVFAYALAAMGYACWFATLL